MFGPKIKVRKDLYQKLRSAARAIGAASLEEFTDQVLEREADRILERSKGGKKEASAAEVEDIAKKLKGLGYLD